MPDPITHLSISFVVARHRFREYKVLFLCSTIIPDIDGLIGILYIFFFLPSNTPREEMARIFQLFHPSLPASFLFLPFFVLLVLFSFRFVNRRLVPESFKEAYLLILTAMLIHLGLDLLMTGNKPFWPFQLEAGIGVIPYNIWGSVLPPIIALLVLAGDQLLLRIKKKGYVREE